MKNILFVSAALLLPMTASAVPMGLEDVAKVTKRDDGKYDVECTYGGTEEGVTLEALKAGKVCQLGAMRKMVAFKKFVAEEGCYLSQYDHVTGVTGSTATVANFAIDSKEVFKVCKLGMHYAIPAGYQIGIKKVNVALTLSEYDGDPVSVLFGAGEEENGQVADVEVSKQGASAYDLEFDDYVFTGCSKGMNEAQKFSFEMFLAPTQGGVNGGTAALSGVKYLDVAIRPCS